MGQRQLKEALIYFMNHRRLRMALPADIETPAGHQFAN